MSMEMATAVTSDGIRLQGSFSAAQNAGETAVVCLHGAGSNFYGSTLFDSLAQGLQPRGHAVLRVNTRGHDGVTWLSTTRGPRPGGSAYECVDDCRYDVVAWVNWLLERDYPNIVLLGHSLGAIKAVYSQAYEPHPSVRSVIAVSPPRLSASLFLEQGENGPYARTIATARKHVDEGHPEHVMRAKFPFPLLITAEGYIDKYGPQERYDILKFAGKMQTRSLFVFGSSELESGGLAFKDLNTQVAQLTSRVPPDVKVVSGADHMYTGRHSELLDTVAGWLDQ